MRKYLVTVFFLFLSMTVFGQIIDKPAATVTLTKRAVVTQKQLKQQIEIMEKELKSQLPKEQRKDVLEKLIDAALLIQAAERDGIKVSDLQVNNLINQQSRAVLEAQYGKMSDADFKKRVSDLSGISYDDFFKQVKDGLIQQTYISEKKKDLLGKAINVTDSEIGNFFDENAMQFVNPDIVKFNQIFVDTRSMNADAKEKTRKELDALYKDIQNGKQSFNDVLVRHMETPKPNYQVDFPGYLARNDKEKTALLGSAFYDTMFGLSQGDVRGVIESRVGLHIVRMVEKIPKKFLTLDDRVLPDQEGTVREYIRQYLTASKQQTVYQQAITELVSELRKKAEIKTYPENLNW